MKYEQLQCEALAYEGSTVEMRSAALRELRDQTGESVDYCRRILLGRAMLVVLSQAKTFNDLKPVLHDLVLIALPQAGK